MLYIDALDSIFVSRLVGFPLEWLETLTISIMVFNRRYSLGSYYNLGDRERDWINEYERVKVIFPAIWFVIESFCSHAPSYSCSPSSPLLSLLQPLPPLVSSLTLPPIKTPTVSPTVIEAHRLLSLDPFFVIMNSNSPINLHITNDNTSINIPLTIHTYIQSQLLSIQGNSLLCICSSSPNEHFIQALHDSVSYLCLSGRKNDESISNIASCIHR